MSIHIIENDLSKQNEFSNQKLREQAVIINSDSVPEDEYLAEIRELYN